MYQIGMFSKMNQTTIKTLHHYDEIGLLKPARIDKETGYRYYDLGQSYTLHRIYSLKQMGFQLDEIKKIIGGTSKKSLLQEKKLKLLAEIAEKTKSLAQVEFYLMEKEEDFSEYEILIKELPEVTVVSNRKIIDSHQRLFQVMPEMGAKMEQLGCVCAKPEYCFSIYHDGEYRETAIDVEICEAVTEIKTDALGLTFKTIPQVQQAACLFHKGSYQQFPKAYYALVKWMEANGYEPADFPRESYLDGIWNKENENEWLTEIQFPIRKK